MMTQKQQNNGFRFLAIILTTAVIVIASGLHDQPVSAQSPGFKGAKTANPIAASTSVLGPKKIVPYAVTTGQVQKELLLTGELGAANSILIKSPNIRSASSAMITFLAPEGEPIKKGQRIVEFDDSSLLSGVTDAQRGLDETDLAIAKKKVDLEAQRCDLLNSLAQAEAQLKQDQLYGKIGKELLPSNTYQKYQLNVEKSKLSLQKVREQLDNFEKGYASQMALVEISKSQAEIKLKKIESDMTLLKIDAPQDGILIYGDNWASNRKYQVGDSISQGRDIANLPDLASMQVIGNVYDTEYGSLARDMRCTVSFDALADFSVGGRITSLTNVGDRKGFFTQKKVFKVTIQLDKVDIQKMKPGMTARVKIPIVLAKEALVIPREYLGIDSQGRSYVLVGANTKTAGIKFIEVGAIGDRQVQVVSVLSAGDQLLPVRL